MPTIPAATLKEFALELLVAGGVGREEAGLVADSLVGANLRGHDSHGVMRIPYYLDTVAKGEVVPGAEFKVMKESPTLLVADGGWGFGQTQARRLMDGLIAKAKQSGAGIGTLIHCGHIGRLGEYCEQAAAAGLVSMIMVNTHGHMRRVAPVGGKAPGWAPTPWPSACRTMVRRWCSTSAPAPRPKARCGSNASPARFARMAGCSTAKDGRRTIQTRCTAIRPEPFCRWAARRPTRVSAWG